MAVSDINLECCGCGACESICPTKAITLLEDKETFLYPSVNYKLCIGCGLCEKTCPLSYDSFISSENIVSFVGNHLSDSVNFNSSSGGAFTAIYQVYINKGYKVYGVQYDENFRVVYGCVRTIKECAKFRKSKYVQSYYNNCYESIAEDLKSGESVLFSGVSCYCAALLLYLRNKGIDNSNLVTVNILCHGVPSQKMLDAYIKEEQEKEKSHIHKIIFRNKQLNKDGTNNGSSLVEFSNGRSYIRTDEDDAFLRGYFSRLFYRPSCAECHFATEKRLSDFTIADAWNIEQIRSGYDTFMKGASLLLVNTDKARLVMREIMDKMILEEVPNEWSLKSQGVFYKPTDVHKNRSLFFELWPQIGFGNAVFRCTRPTIKRRIINMFPLKMRSIVKGLVSYLCNLL